MSDHSGGPVLGRRSLLALGTAAVGGVLAACGGDGAAGTATTGSAGGAAAKPRLDQWYHQYGEAGARKAVERYAAAFPDAAVTVTWKPDSYDQSTAASLVTEAGPDVFEYANGPTIDMIKEGRVVDLSDLLGGARNDFQQSILGRMTYHGKVYAIPQVVDAQLLVYRRSMFDRAGLTPPQTMDELIAVAEELTSRDTKGIFLGNDAGAGQLGGPMLWSAGLDFLTDSQLFGFDDARAGVAFGKLRQLWDADVLLLDAPEDWSDASPLVDSRTAMQFTGLWTLPDLKDGLGDDFGVLPWPALDDRGNPSVPVGAYGACVSASSANVGLAKQYVKWLWVDQTAHQLDFATSYGLHIPARTRLIRKATALSSGIGAEAAALVTEYGQVQSPMLWTPKAHAAFVDMMTRIIKEGADPMTETGKIKLVVDAELERVLA